MMPPVAKDFDADQVIGDVARRLREQFPDRDPARIHAVVREEVERLGSATVTDYVSVLSTKAAKKRLKQAE
jgi:hypothetical protein